jgi:hypothetical protein
MLVEREKNERPTVGDARYQPLRRFDYGEETL